ncbi:MAG: tetratricopeptide repeat protein [Ignavibacteria bacterium]|nr:tetratricopeptide repeat protein [Ignavibacteria bacterium]
MNKAAEKVELRHKINKAESLEAEGKLLHAVQIYNSIIDTFPAQKEPYYKLIALYEKLQNIEAAHNLLTELISLSPEDKELRLYLAHFLFRNEKWDETLETLEFLNPDFDLTIAFINGYSHYMLKEFELANISFQKFVALDRTSEFLPDAYIHLAKANINLNRYEEALKYIKTAENYFESYYELHFIYAIIYYYLGMNEHSIERIKKALRFKKIDNDVYAWAGKIYFKSNDYEKAKQYFDKYLSLSEEGSADIYAQLGLIAVIENDLPLARNYFETSLKFDSENQLVLSALKNIPELKVEVEIEISDG